MRIAILSSGIPTIQYPLNGVFAFDQAKALAAAGVDVSFLSVDLRSIRKRRKWGFSSGVKDGIKWYNASVPVGPIWIIHKLITKRIVIALYKKTFKNEQKPDLLHAHFASSYAYFLGKEYGIPYVITEHSSGINCDVLSEDVKSSITKYYKGAERVLAVSHALSKRIECHTGVKSLVVPNIVDVSLFSLVERVGHQGFRMATTSNLISLKRTINILKVLPEIISMNKNIHLDIIGDGELKQELMNFVNDNKLDDFVTFHGLLSRQQIAKVYEKADCFVLPSITETFGVAYVEAMAVGLPVIATRCGGPEDFVNERNGIMIDVDDLSQLKDAIVQMIHHSGDFNSVAIKSNVVEKFSPSKVAERLISIYKEIIF